jgi:hypothetical protein
MVVLIELFMVEAERDLKKPGHLFDGVLRIDVQENLRVLSLHVIENLS